MKDHQQSWVIRSDCLRTRTTPTELIVTATADISLTVNEQLQVTAAIALITVTPTHIKHATLRSRPLQHYRSSRVTQSVTLAMSAYSDCQSSCI